MCIYIYIQQQNTICMHIYVYIKAEYNIYVCMCIYIYLYMYVCMCIYIYIYIYTHIYAHTHIYIYMYIYLESCNVTKVTLQRPSVLVNKQADNKKAVIRFCRYLNLLLDMDSNPRALTYRTDSIRCFWYRFSYKFQDVKQ